MRALALAAFLIGLPATALAGGGFDIVVPGRPGVPIIINNIDASYTVVEGVWGLGKNGPGAAHHLWRALCRRAAALRCRPLLSDAGLAAWLWPPRGRAAREPQAAATRGQLPPELGRVNPRRCRRRWTCPVDPPPVILAPEINVNPPHRRPRPRAEDPGRPPG